MKKRIAINGFGRIGRVLTRILSTQNDIEIVAINDLAAPNVMAHLLKYDSTHGIFNGVIELNRDKLQVNEHHIILLNIASPELLPWNDLKVDIVIEATGKFKSLEGAQKHIAAGASKVIVSAPPDGTDIKTIVLGVNSEFIDGDEKIISNASCTTNNAAPMIQLIDKLCQVESCYISTVHSYTGDQRLQDAPHKDLRRGRAAAESIVPTTTGAAKALTKIFPHLSDAIGGCGIRVPVINGSLTDITFVVKNPISAEAINQAFKEASSNKYLGILEYSEDPLVSRDIIGNSHSCVFDSELTSVIGNMVKMVGWYDNEYGYSSRLVDLIRILN